MFVLLMGGIMGKSINVIDGLKIVVEQKELLDELLKNSDFVYIDNLSVIDSNLLGIFYINKDVAIRVVTPYG